MLPLWEGKTTVIERSSTYETMRPSGIDILRGATYSGERRGQIGDL